MSTEHCIANFRITPFSSCDVSTSLPGAARAADALRQWLRDCHFPSNDIPLVTSPSTAALCVFRLIQENHHNLRINLVSRPPEIDVTIRLPAPPCTPVLLHSGCESLRIILWHFTSFRDSSLLPTAPCGFACDSTCIPSNKPELFHLSRVFKSSPPPSSSPKRPRPPNCFFLSLPDDILHKIILFLDPKDYEPLSRVHPYMQDFLRPIVPGLLLRLYPHQVHALSRMIQMERLRYHPFPLLEELHVPTLETGHIFADLVDGSIMLLENVPRAKLPRGGLLCDEPGLGKTISALSLVLRTVGKSPEIPASREMRYVRTSSRQTITAYKENLIARYEMYGKSTIDCPSRRARLLPELVGSAVRRSSRSVRPPDFYATSKGLGALPAVMEEQEIFACNGTLIVVPSILVRHWQTQIELYIQKDALRVIYLSSRHDLPESAAELASHDLILVSFDFLKDLFADLRHEAPLLLQLHFLRVIVDEGHRLSSSQLTNFASVCDRIRADSRWIMTGTPTPSTPRTDIDHLQSLLTFIRDEGYGLDKDAWRVGVREPYSKYKSESLTHLSGLLKEVMIRADKSLILAECLVKTIFLDFSKESAESYNGLVRMTRRNLITSDWFDPNHIESLLNSANAKQARAVMANLRKACCFGGTMEATFNREDVIYTLDQLYDIYRKQAGIHKEDRFKDPLVEQQLLEYGLVGNDSEKERYEDIRRRSELYNNLVQRGRPPLRLARLDGPDGSQQRRMAYSGKLETIGKALLYCRCKCARCEQETSYPLVTPCGHLLCDECVARSRFICVAKNCGAEYRLDNKMIPEDLIELQPSVVSENWREDWADTKSAKMNYLINRIEALPLNEEWVDGESSPRITSPKVIVHSEYGDHLKLVALHMKGSEKLRDRYVEMVVNTMELHSDAKKVKGASKYAAQSVRKFSEDPNISILLMNTKHGAVGLDLSFVQYIFLLEPLWDAANELQIISRAHRIGCRQNIYVERLVMKNSVEEAVLMASLEYVNLRSSGVARAKMEQDDLRVRESLRRLQVVHGGLDRPSSSDAHQNDKRRADWFTDGFGTLNVPESSDSGGGSTVQALEDSSLSSPCTQSRNGALKRPREERDASPKPRPRVRFRD